LTAALQHKVAPPPAVPIAADGPVTQLHALTALRFFAASSVVVCHIAGNLLQNSLAGNIAFSHSVSFFFVLSGFILTYTHPQVNGRQERLSFWRARFARIYPAHIFSLCVIMFFVPWSHLCSNVLQLVANVFLVHCWVPHYTFFQCYDLPSWSVSDEVFFYLLFPVLILNLRRTWLLKLALSLALALTVIALPAVIKFPTGGLNGLTIFGMYYFFPPARLFEFVLGMSCAVLWSRIRNYQPNTVVATGLELFTLTWFYIYATNTSSFLKPLLTSSHMFWQGLGTWLTLTGNCFAFGAMILIFATERGLIARAIRRQPFIWGGDVSYSTYLLHFPIMIGVMELRQRFGLDPLTTVALMLGILIPASALSYHCVEMPMRKFILGKKKKVQKQPRAEISPLPEYSSNTK
jgi:peptidoglycan/LPS O-acetylase OafA/YrhL